jgi:hypothetical protein
MADPYLGVHIGFAVSGGRIWSAGGPPRPAMVILGSGLPFIGVPQYTFRLHVKNKFLPVDTLNKPMGFSKDHNLRAYTRAFSTEVKAPKPFRAIVITHLSPGIPIQIFGGLRGVITEIRPVGEVQPIPEDALLIAEPPDVEESKSAFKYFKVGQRVILWTSVRTGIRSDIQEAIGGLPMLVSEGKVSVAGESETGDYLRARHPRTAVCYTYEKYIFASEDSTQPKLCIGLTIDKLAIFTQCLGCI